MKRLIVLLATVTLVASVWLPVRGQPPAPPPAKKFKTGARPTPKHKIFAARKHDHTKYRALPQVAYVPKTLSVWGNDTYGDCVSAEEAFNQDACGVFIDQSVVIDWARSHGFLNGADLAEVMDAMAKDGMVSGGKTYGDGPYATVDYTSDAALQTALSIAPVKLGIDSSALPSGAGNQQGWYAFGGKPGQFSNEDHCVPLAGYGPASFCFKSLGVPLPSGIDPNKPCYLLFTWSTIGVVDLDWIKSTAGEAWLRNPDQTVNGQPQPNPGPNPGPGPQPGPITITSILSATATLNAPFTYQITATGSPSVFEAAGLPFGLACSATGVITGSPQSAGTYPVTISAAEPGGLAVATLQLTVTGSPAPTGPTIIVSQDLKAGTYTVVPVGSVVLTDEELAVIKALAARFHGTFQAKPKKVSRAEFDQVKDATLEIMKALEPRSSK